jgi:hypothetical protein
MPDALIRKAEEISAEWLCEALERPGLEILDAQPIGTGQMSQSYRVAFGGDRGRESVVVKLASDNPTSRATGVGMGAYAREIAFYRQLAERIDCPLARCHLAIYDETDGWFTLVLEDLVGTEQGDQIAGCSVEQARIALGALARVHAPFLGDAHLGTLPWLNQASPIDQALVGTLLPSFLERYGERIAPEHAEVCKRFASVFDAWAADRRPPLGLVHGDFRLDNLLFDDTSCKVVDWQTISCGPAMVDATYLLGGGLKTADRRAHEQELIRAYHSQLLGLGARGFSWDTCWEEYRRQSVYGLMMTIVASMVVVRTERGDDMFMSWLERNAQQVIDLDALSLLPEPTLGRPAPLQPAPEDEDRHEPGTEVSWNESWYFDAVSDDGSVGAYVRIGRLPNRGVALYTAAIVGPGRPAVLVVEAAAPLPAPENDNELIAVEGLRAEQDCEEPLQRFRVKLAARGEAHADASAPLRAEPGTPVEVELDLLWQTDGVPYQWRAATRYEIPCRVSGTLRVGEQRLAFAGPGQRDHSWGARDWWANDWMWNALHLDDGTHTHTVTIAELPGLGVGYIQRAGELREIETATSSEQIAANGLIASATISSGPEQLTTEIEPLAFGALRLVAPDGRVTHFPRAMCRVRTADGRSGCGWIEWNRNQRGDDD